MFRASSIAKENVEKTGMRCFDLAAVLIEEETEAYTVNHSRSWWDRKLVSGGVQKTTNRSWKVTVGSLREEQHADKHGLAGKRCRWRKSTPLRAGKPGSS